MKKSKNIKKEELEKFFGLFFFFQGPLILEYALSGEWVVGYSWSPL
jgi:hypothetical protein